MEKKRRGPKPTGRTVRQFSVALRPDDQAVLLRLALEQTILLAHGDPEQVWGLAARGIRPSVSFALRYLVDEHRKVRIKRAAERWAERHPGQPVPSDEELLRPDFVFGSPGGPGSLGGILARLEPHEIVDGTLQRRDDYELRTVEGGAQRPAKKGRTKR
jgi:hypothetical protein